MCLLDPYTAAAVMMFLVIEPIVLALLSPLACRPCSQAPKSRTTNNRFMIMPPEPEPQFIRFCPMSNFDLTTNSKLRDSHSPVPSAKPIPVRHSALREVLPRSKGGEEGCHRPLSILHAPCLHWPRVWRHDTTTGAARPL